MASLEQLDQLAWQYPLTDVTESKNSLRSGLRPLAAAPNQYGGQKKVWELIGYDGSIAGGLRPFPGFGYFTQLPGGSGTIGWFRVVAVRVNADDYRIVMLYRRGTTVYATTVEASPVTATIATAIPATSQLDVAVWGRNGYLAIEGMSPVVFYITTGGAIITGVPGPGAKPQLISPDQSPGLGLRTTIGGTVTLTNSPPSLTSQAQADSDVRRLSPGNYGFAYRLYDSRTGRWGPLSDIGRCETENFRVDTADLGSLFAAMEIVYAKATWDTYFIYRSVRVQAAGGTFSTVYMLLDSTGALVNIDGSGSGSGGTDLPAGLGRFVWYYESADEELVFADAYTDSAIFDATMPQAGALFLYEQIMFAGKVRNGVSSFVHNIGEIRWSSASTPMPELFPPANRFVPRIPTNEVIRFVQVGPNVIGFARDRMYHIRRESIYVRIQEMHPGFGLVGPEAVEVVGQLAFFVTPTGMKTVDTNGQLEDVNALNYLIGNQWVGHTANIKVVFDARLKALFVHNPDVGYGHTAVLWFDTSQVTELVDTRFAGAATGPFPSSWTPGNTPDYNSPAVDRTYWVTPNGYVYLADADRARTVIPTLLQMPTLILLKAEFSQCRFTVTSISGTRINLNASNANFSSTRFQDAVAYALGGPGAGSKALIVGGGLNYIDVDVQIPGLVKDNHIGISPVYCRVVGAKIPVVDQFNNSDSDDQFRTRQVDAIGGSFVDVGTITYDATPPTDYDDRYRGLLYVGNSLTPASARFPALESGGDFYHSLASGAPINPAPVDAAAGDADAKRGIQGPVLVPGIETFCPELDYTLIGMQVTGRNIASDRPALRVT